jgi:asparagine synthase (glutamine-hydrolysing)
MCGIVGCITKNKIDLKDQLKKMAHRGPDNTGEFYYQFSDASISIGHLRLSILDLDSRANQPFVSDNGRYSLTYNGEIYNFIKLRKKLVLEGFEFRTNSDTEVLMKAYECYGSKLVDYLDGMFAFCIVDTLEGVVFLARDHLGIKPIYYHHNQDNHEFYFSSELKSLFSFENIQKKICKKSIAEFLFNGWLYEPDTGYSQVYKIPPGGCITIDVKSMHVNHDIYFDVSKTEKDSSLGDINELVSNSISEQCVSDVPLGIFFSGGVDSTVIASKIRHAQCLSAKYKDEDIINSGIGNDFLYSQQISTILDLSLTKVELEEDIGSIDSIRNTVIHNEELLSDFTYNISEEISILAKKNGYKVMLSGMGADEMFGGYDRYKAVAYKKLYQLIAFLLKPLKKHIKKIKTFDKKINRFYTFIKEKDFCYSYSSLIGSFSREEIENLLIDTSGIEKYHRKINKYLNNVSDKTPYKKAFYLDLYGFLPHNFMVADKSSMQASIEMRVPLANKDILVKNFHRKDSDMFDFFSMKKDLKLMLKNLIPARIINRRKTGFNPPMDGVINRIGEDKIRQILSSESLSKYINTKNLDSLIVEHFHKEVNNTYKLWNLVYLSIWIEVNE